MEPDQLSHPNSGQPPQDNENLLSQKQSPKKKELYTIGTELPRQFFESGRGIASILKGNKKLGDAFREKYADRFPSVRDYYNHRKNRVVLRDVAEIVPRFRSR